MGWPGLLQRVGQRGARGIGRIAGQAQEHEQPIVAVDAGAVRSLVVDGDEPLAVLAGRLGDQLFQPGAEAVDPGRRDDRHLVAPELRPGDAQDRAQHDAGVLLDRHARHAGVHHRARSVQELGHVDAHRRRRHQTEVRQHRVAPADVRPAEEDPPKMVRLRDVLHLRVRIGDGDETVAGLFVPDRLNDALVEVLLEDVGLQRRARLAGDDEQRPLDVDGVLRGLDLRRVGRVQDV